MYGLRLFVDGYDHPFKNFGYGVTKVMEVCCPSLEKVKNDLFARMNANS